MSRHRLHNALFGFESSCFVCEPANERGLGIEFFYDDETEVVSAEYALGPQFSGAPRYVHGGVTLAVLDEAMAWAAIAVTGSFAVTKTTTARFRRPVRVGDRCRVEARIEGRTGRSALDASAVVRDERGRACAEAQATFVLLSGRQARSAIGELSAEDARFVQG